MAGQFVFKINTLPPEPDFQIDASHIKNLPATRVVGGGLTQMRADMLYQPLGSSGGVGAWSTPSESVAADGSVVEFTVGTTAPTDLVSDGTTLFEGFGYTYSSPKVTLTNGPTQFIKYR